MCVGVCVFPSTSLFFSQILILAQQKDCNIQLGHHQVTGQRQDGMEEPRCCPEGQQV